MKIEKVSKRKLKVDLFLLIPILFISLIGIVALLSTTITIDGSFGDTSIITKQLIFLASGFILFFLLSFIDISILRMWQIILPIYLGTIALLILVLIFGPVVNNVQRWLVVGGIQIQPSEIAKVTVILTTAMVLSYKDKYNEWVLFLSHYFLQYQLFFSYICNLVVVCPY